MRKTVRSLLKSRNALMLLLLLAAFGASRAQAVYNMPPNDTVYIYPCLMPSGVIYDNGGVDGNYANSCESWAILSVPSGVTITLTGSYATESGYDKIWVYAGQGATGTELVSGVSGTGNINVTSTTGWMSIRFHSDGSTANSGFALTYSIGGVASSCTNPVTSLLTSEVGDTSAVLTWSAANAAGPFLVMVGDTTFTVSDTTVAMEWLNPNTHYDITVSSIADNGAPCCMAHGYFRTLCGMMHAPLVENFDDYAVGVDVLPNCWVRQYNFDATGMYPQVSSTQSYSSPASLMMYCGSNNVDGHWALAIGPELIDTMSTLYLRLKMRCSYSNAKLEVGVCNDTTLTGNGFTPVDTLTVSTANTWEEKLMSLASYTGTGTRIAFRMIRSLQPANGLSIYVDDLSVEPCGIWHQQRQERNTTEMKVAWDVIGEPTVDIEVGVSGSLAGTGTMYSNVTSPYLITGLEPGTEYSIRFYTTCNGITKQQGTLVASTLPRDARALNFCEAFENNGNNVPTGWRRLNIYSSTPSVSTSAAFGGSYGLYFYTNGANRPIAVMPLIDTVDIDELMVSFMARSYDYATGRIEIGVMQYPEYPSSFVPVDTVEVPLSWSRRTAQLSNYAGAGQYIAFRAYDQNNYSNHLYLDNLEIGPCLVTGQTVTNIASHSVELQWDSVAADWVGDSITIEYGAAGFAAGSGTIVRVSANGSDATFSGGKQWLKITGLDTLTAYQFLIYGECSGMTQYCDIVRVNATTLESDPTLPLCEGFENYGNNTIPTAWLRPAMASGYPQTSSSGVHTGSRSMELYAYGNDHSVLAMPMLDVDSVQGLTVSFYTHATHGYGVIEVGVMDNPNDESTFTTVSSQSINDGGYKHHVVTIANYSGSGKYIAFRYTTPSCTYCGYHAYLDDIVVSDAATANNKVYSVTSQGATVSWSGTGRSYVGAEIEWGPTGFQQGTGSKDTVDANTFTYTLDTLDAGVMYDLLVTALSSETANNCNYTRNTFQTAAEPMQASWCYGFEDYGYNQFPASWTRPQMYNGTPMVNSEHHWGERDMLFYSNNSGNTKSNSMAVLPYLEEDTLDDIKLRFYANGSGTDNKARMVIGMLSNPNDVTTFDTIADTNLYTGGQWQLFEVDLSTYTGTNRHLAFQLSAPSTSGWWSTVHLDDITLSKCWVKDVMSYSATTGSFIVNWTSEGTTESVELEYGPAGFTPGSGTVVSNATAPYTLTGLAAQTSYDFYLRPYCTASGSTCAETKYSATTLGISLEDGYCEDFDHYNYYALPEGWNALRKSSGYPYICYFGESENDKFTSPTGSLVFYNNPSESNLLVLPMAEETVSNLVLTFNMRCNSEQPELATMVVGVMTLPYDSTTFVAVDTLHPGWSFEPYNVDLSSYSGTGSHIAFRYIDNGYRYTYVDDLRLSHSAVGDLYASDVTDQSVTLHWQQMGYSDTTWMAFDTVGDNAQMTCLNNVSQLTLDTLQPGTTYHLYFWGEGQDTSLACQATKIVFTTLQEPLVLPYCDGFESYADGTPAGWTFPYTMQYLGVEYMPNTIAKVLRMPAKGGANNRTSVAVMPAYNNGSLSDAYLDFFLSADYYNMTLHVGVMSDPLDTTTFTELGSYEVATPASWRHIKLPLSGYSGTGKHVAFFATSTNSNIFSLYVDDVNLRSCAVSQATLHNPMETSMMLTWATTGVSDGIYVEYKATGANGGDFLPGAGTMIHVTESPYTFTGLEEATYYTFHVYPACDSVMDGCNYDTYVMQTLHPWVGLPYCENFEEISTPIPNNWVNLSTQQYYPQHAGPAAAHNDSISSYVSMYAVDSSYSMFALPRIYIGATCDTLDKVYANFWLNFTSNGGAALFEVGVMTDVNDASTFVPHDTATYGEDGWHHYILGLSNYNTADSYVAFRLSSSDGSGVYCDFDDLCMEKCVSAEITISDITQNSVTITWDNYSVDTLICEYGPKGYALGSGTIVSITENPYVLTGLDDGTLYDFSFSSVCGCNQYGATYTPGSGSWGIGGGWGGSGWGWWCCVPCTYDSTQWCRYWRWGWWQGHSWSWWYNYYSGGEGGEVVFPAVVDVTTQAAIMEPPYCERFEMDDTVAFPPSWRRGEDKIYPGLTTTNNHSGEKSMRFYATTSSSCYAALPPLEVGDVQQMVLTFHAYSTSNYALGSNGRFIVGVMSDPDDESTFVPVDTVGLTAVATWEQHAVDFASYSGIGQYIALRFAPTGGAYNFFVDDLYVGRCAISDVVLETGLESVLFPGAGNGGATSDPYVVKLSWTQYHLPDSILIVYGPQGFVPGDSTTVDTIKLAAGMTALNLTSYGIDADSSYDIYVTSICSDTSSSCFVSPLTLNPTLMMPYCADFEDLPSEDWQTVDPLLPTNWHVVRRNSSKTLYPRLENQDSQNVIVFYPSTGNSDNLVTLPPLPDSDSLTGKWVYACFSTESNGNPYLQFGALSDTGDASTFVSMGTMSISSGSTTMKEMNVQLSNGSAPTTGNYFAIRATCSSGQRWLRLSKLAVSNYPYPTAVKDVAMGVATRKLTWSGANGNAYYTVEYGYGNNWQTVSSDSCQAVLTGLDPDKEYTVNFISPSGERLCLPYTFTSEDYQGLPYCENFDSYANLIVPANWYSYSSYNDNYPRTYDNCYNSCCRTLDFYCNNSHTQYTALPDLEVDSIRHLDLSFSLRIEEIGSTKLVVGVMDDRTDLNTFTPVDTLTCTSNSVHYPQHINLSSYQGGGRYVAFRFMTTTSGRTSIFIDDLVVSPCPLPDFTVYGADAIMASLPAGSEADYYIEYAPNSFVQGEGDTVWSADSTAYTVTPTATLVHVTENPYYLTGLNASSTYTLYARCDSLVPTCAPPVTLKTSDRVPLPYCDDFSTYDDYTLPTGWASYYTNGNSHLYVNYNDQLEFYNYNSNSYTQVMLPDVDVDSVRHADILLNMYSDYASYNYIVVGVMTDRNDMSTFVPVDTLRNTVNNTWQYDFHPRMNRYQGDGRFIAFRMMSTSNYRYTYIDDLRIQSCPRPTVALVEGTTVRMKVDTTFGTPDYWVEYGPQGITQLGQDTLWNADSTQYSLQQQNTLIHVTQNPFFITGLDENSTYDFFTRCDSAEATCFPVQRITTSTILNLPLCYDFSNYGLYELPPYWRKYNNNPYSSDYPYVYNNNICFYNYYSYNICQLTLPDLNIDSVRHLNIRFDLQAYSSTSDGMIVGVMDNPDDMSSFTPVDTLFCPSTSGWYTREPRMYRYEGSGRFVAFHTMNTGNYRYMYINNLRIQSCPQATVSLCAGTTVRIDVDTTASAPDYWVEYGPQGISQLAEDTLWSADSTQYSLQPHNTLIHVTETPYFITNLTAGATYDFYTRCDSAVATCYPVQRKTMSNVLNIPQCEDFSNCPNNNVPPFWRRYTNDTYYTTDPVKNDNALRFRRNYSTSVCQAVLPDFNIDSIKNLNLTFSIKGNSLTNGIIVGVLTDPDNPETFVAVDTMHLTVTNEWQQVKPRLNLYNGVGRFVALRELSTGTFYANYFYVESCDIPANASATLHGHNIVRIDADTTSNTGFWVEYDSVGFAQGTGTYVYCSTLPMDLTLENATTYDFYFRCDTMSLTCRPKQTVSTMSEPQDIPLCEGFESYSKNTLPTGWQFLHPESNSGSVYVYNSNAHSGSNSLYFKCYYNYHNYAILPDLTVDSLNNLALSFWLKGASGSSLTVGVVSDPTDASSFLPVQTVNCYNDEYVRHLVTLNNLPTDARFLAFRNNIPNGSGYKYIYLDDLFIDTVGAADFRVTNIAADEVTFVWNQVGHPAMTIEYGPVGFTQGTGTVLTVTQSPFTVTGLDPLTNHQFYFTSVGDSTGDYCTTYYCDSTTIFTPAGGTGCIDPTNLTAEYTTCFYGTYGNPYYSIGVIDYGASDISSRHTVCYDTNAYDPRTDSLLRIVPEGASASVRLGNWNSSGVGSQAEAEAVAYTLFVDTTSFDLLVLRYAAVLQDPLHDPADQPRFKLEVLDSTNMLLDAQCAAADFIANRNLGWNEAADNVLWKDWTTVGVDLSPYAGQQVKIRLTTYDCAEGNHYGYAYFTVGCQKKNMKSELCGDVDSNTFYAPAGFVYRWYSSADTLDTISTAQMLKVATDTVYYYCECSFVDNPSCQFTISAYAGTRYPLADFTYTVAISDCQFHVTFTNTSAISPDGINPLASGEPCESALWDFGNGQASTSYHASIDYDSAGSYTVSLISGIADDECTDTATYVLNLAFPAVNYTIDGQQHLCLGDTTTLAVYETVSRLWSTGASDTAIIVAPDTTTLYSCFVVDSNGCHDTLTRLVNVYDNSQYEDNQTTVENLLPYTWNNRVYYNDTVDTITLTNIAGCDSTVLFSLHVFFNVADTADSTICESQLPLVWNDSTFTATASKNTLLLASTGADSLLTMNLYVIPTTYDTIYDTVVENDLPYTFLSHVFATDTLGDTLHLVNMAGCDSIITYNLFVHRNVVDTVSDTVCESQLPFVWNSRTFTLDTTVYDTLLAAFVQQDTLLAASGADSLLTMQLTVIPTTYSIVNDTVVENSLPWSFHHRTYTTDTLGDTLHLVNVAGCDSIVTYSLFVHRNVRDTIDSTICESVLPLVWNDSTFLAAGAKTTLLPAATGADSLLTMQLFVIPTTYDTIFDTVVENDLPHTFLSHVYYTDTLGDTLHLVNMAGCDSIITYSLFVHRNVADTVDSTICESQLPFIWNSRTFTLDSTLFDTLLARFVQLDTLTASTGADSLLTMRVAVSPTTYAIVADTILQNELPYLFNGTTYTLEMFEADSNYFATLSDTLTILNAAGCDSVVTYSLSVQLNKTVVLDSAICASELPLQWNARTFTLDTTYYDTLQAAFVQYDTLTAATGADSILVMNLTVHDIYHWMDTLVVCRNQLPYTWRDTVLLDSTLSGDYFLARVSQYGCDSLMSLHLTMGEVYGYYDTLSVCFDAQPVTWLDTSLTVDSAGFFDIVYPRTTVLGCDSLYNLNLTVRPVYDIHDSVTLCENSLPLDWADTTIAQGSASLTLSRFFTSQVQCDSVRTLHLTVDTNTFSTVQEYVIENNLPYNYHGLILTDDTVGAVLVFDNQHGCDSTVTYSLTVYRNVSTQVEQTVCDDVLPFQWNSRVFTASDVETFGSSITKYDTLLAYTGADSVVQMTLHVNPTYNFTETFGICYDALPYTWHDTVLGIYQTSGTVYRHFVSQQGCDSIYKLNLTVSDVYSVTDYQVSCDSITWIDGITYTASTNTPQVTLQSQAGCDSVVTLNFTILQPSYTHLADSACFGEVYHFGDMELTSGGYYVDTLTAVDNCDSIVTLQLTMLAAPSLTLSAEADCESYTYYVRAETNVDYLHWTVESSSWNNDWGQPSSHLLLIRPYGTQTFTAVADYLEQTTCPVTKSITLSPIVQPLAIINVKPERLNYEQHTLVALDQSTGANWRQWWVNGDDFGDNVRIEFTPDMQEDSVVLELEVRSDHCSDTAVVVVPIFRSSVYAPNAFTPSENSNKEFLLLLDGVVTYELTIYNRQGIEVFHSTNPEIGWDGTAGGRACPQGAYVWILRYTTKEMPRVPQTEKGSVLLLR